MKTLTRILALAMTFAPMSVFCQAQDAPAAADEQKQSPPAKPVELKVGDIAPIFSGTDDKGQKWGSEKLKGKKILIVYFYPADMTGGCTKQACAYRDAIADMKRKDVEVIGVSGDSVENHKHFRDQYKLNFTLLADPNGNIARAFGVKTSAGGVLTRQLGGEEIVFERGLTTRRWTFVIDKQWKIAHVDRKVNAAKDSEKVLKIVEKLPKD